MASTQPTATAQFLPGQGVTSLFQPQQAVTIPVLTSTATPTTSLSDELVRGASFTLNLGVQGASLGSILTFLVMDQDHGSYDPSLLLMFGQTEPLVSCCTKISLPAVMKHSLQNQLPAAESGAASLLEQPIPVSQSEKRQVEGSLGTGGEEDPTDQIDENLMPQQLPTEDLIPQLLPTADMSIVSGDGKERGPKQKAGQGEMEEGQESKRRQLEDREDDGTIHASLVAIKGLVSAVQDLTGQMKRSEEKIEKALIDTTCALARAVDTLCRLKNVIGENGKEK